MVAHPQAIAGQNGLTSHDSHQEQDRRSGTLPHQDRRQFFEKGAVALNQGVRDRSGDFGRDAILEPGRTARPQMMAMVSTIFPELANSLSSQRDAFVKAFENPALVRSYLINPQETAHYLMKRFPEMSEVLLKNMPFQKIGNHLEPNIHSGLYRRISEEVALGVRARDSFVRKEMDKLLSSVLWASLGGSAGMETKAYEFLRNRIEKPGFNKEAERIEYRIAKLMTSPQARQDLKEARGLAAMGALPATAGTFGAESAQAAVAVAIAEGTNQALIPQPQTSTPPQPQQQAAPPAPQAEIKSGIPTTTGDAVNPAELKQVVPPAPVPAAPSNAAPTLSPQPPAMRESASPVQPSQPVAPSVAPPVAPADALPPHEQMYRDYIAHREAQLKKAAETPGAPLAPVTPTTPAPAAQLEQLRQQNKDLSERLARIEKSVEELVGRNSALEKENSELKAKVAELEKRNAELEKTPRVERPVKESAHSEMSDGLSDHEIHERAKGVHDAIGYVWDDLERIYSSMAGVSVAEHKRLSQAFLKEYGKDMDAYLADNLEEEELAIVMKLREGSRPGTEDAIKVYNILHGWTDKSELKQTLHGKSVEELVALASEYEYLTGQSFQNAIKDEFWFESDRKAFLEAFGRAQDVVKVVEEGSPVLKEAHRSISSLSADASINEARAWALKNLELYNTLGASPDGQREFVSYIKTAYGLKENEDAINPAQFFNQKIAEAAVREIANATTPKTIRPLPMAPGAAPMPITVQEPDRERIVKIVDSLADLPEVQGLVRNHPDVRKLGLETKPAAIQPQVPNPAPQQKESAPAIPPVAPPQQPVTSVSVPKAERTAPVAASTSLNQLVEILNSGKGDVQDFLLANKEDLFARTDEEVLSAFRRVNPTKMERFAGSLRTAHRALDSGLYNIDSFTKADITRLGQVATLAKRVSEETH